MVWHTLRGESLLQTIIKKIPHIRSSESQWFQGWLILQLKKKVTVVLGPVHLYDFQSFNLFYFADNIGLPVW